MPKHDADLTSTEKQAKKEAKRQRRRAKLLLLQQASSGDESAHNSDNDDQSSAPPKPAETEEQRAARLEKARKYNEERNRIHHVVVEARLVEHDRRDVKSWTIQHMWPSLADIPDDKRASVKRVLNEANLTAFGSVWFEMRKWYEFFEY